MSEPSARIRLLPDNYTSPYGSPEALENLGTSAAPLLAGFAFALIGLLLDKGKTLWEPDLALILLVLAGVLLIGAVEFAFNARRFHVPPGDYVAFREMAKAHADAAQKRKDTTEAEASEKFADVQLPTLQATWRSSHVRWARRARRAYNAGIVLLFFAMAVVLVPPAGLLHMAPLRVFAVAVPALAGAVELLWLFGSAAVARRGRSRPGQPARG
jgi:hypothetical protein